MADPTKYTPGYSYSGWESANPTSPKPGSELDDDFANVSQSIDEIVDALRDVRKSDGTLANGSVGPDQLSATLSIGFTLRGEWASGVSYAAGDGVTYGQNFYKALSAHVSATGSRPDNDSSTWAFLLAVSTIAVTDGSITAAKLDATDAEAIRDVIGQTELVSEAMAEAATKTGLVDADTFPIADSVSTGTATVTSWSNIKAKLFEALGGLMGAGTAKSTPTDTDSLLLSDSAASNATKKLLWADLKTTVFAGLGALIAAGTAKTSPIDADTLPLSDSAASGATKKLAWSDLKATLKTYFDGFYGSGYLPGYKWRMSLANNASDATNDIDISVGKCVDNTTLGIISLAATMTKRLDANWSAGSGNGGRYSGAAIANTTYHVWAASKADGTSDVYFDPSTSRATVLSHLQAETGGSGYVNVRRIGSIIRTGGAIVAFKQYGDEFYLKERKTEFNGAAPATTAQTLALQIPTGLTLQARINAGLRRVNGSGLFYLLVTPLTETDGTPSSSLYTACALAEADRGTGSTELLIMTNTSAQIRWRANDASANLPIDIWTIGWCDPCEFDAA